MSRQMHRKTKKTNPGRPLSRMVWFVLLFSLLLPFPYTAKAEEGVLQDSVWEYMFESEAVTDGIVQSICITDQYIITIENAGDNPELADVVTAYYKNDYDRDGNPVERFSIANRVQLEEWEHGNGMCWNPVVNEIYVTLYTNTIEDNRGCLYVMDPDTLTRKGRIKVTDDFNLLAITYDNANDRYFIQTNEDADYRILILNSEFQIVEDYGPESADPGYNFQDFTLVKDYLLQFPLTWNMGIGEYMIAYSVPERQVVDTIQLFFDELPDEKYIEPESIAWLDEESFLVPVNATAYDNSRRCLFYRVRFPRLIPPPAAPETEEQSSQVVSAVSSTAVESIETSVSVKKGNQQLTHEEAPPEQKKIPVGLIIGIVLAAAFVIAAVLYLQYVRRERAKREARMRKARRRLMARAEQEREGIDPDIDYLEEFLKDL